MPNDWWWDIDIDPTCLEIRAEPLESELYAASPFRNIIDQHIYGPARNLGLKTGDAGQGGGHLSVDMATGFGPGQAGRLNVVKTLALVELRNARIDENVKLIDVLDNKNAPYLLYLGREDQSARGAAKLKGLLALRDWMISALRNQPLAAPTGPPEKGKAKKEKKDKAGRRQQKKEKDKAITREGDSSDEETAKPAATTTPAIDPEAEIWDKRLIHLGQILRDNLAFEPGKFGGGGGQNKGMFQSLSDIESLHYAAVNLQHTRSAGRDPSRPHPSLMIPS